MKVLFVYSGYENLGIEYLSSFLKANGHETSLLFDPAIFSGDMLMNSKVLGKLFSLDKKIIKKAISSSPDLIAFSAYTGNYRWCLKLAEAIKTLSKVPIVFGGIHPTAVPHEVLKNECVDYIVVGEGEHALLELVEYMKGKSEKDLSDIQNLGYKRENKLCINPCRGYIRALDDIPFPDKELFYNKVPLLQEGYLIGTSRGCPFDCTYCSNNMFRNIYCNEFNHLRRRSPQNVIGELKLAKSKWDIKIVTFVDDVMTFSKKWLEEFIPLYKKEIGIPFFCSVHPNTITKEIASLLKEGGCSIITMGVQSGSERIRKEIFTRHTTNDKILASINDLKEEGMTISLDNIFGAPTETEEDLKLGLDLYNKAKPDRMFTFWLTYYPNTKIISIAKEHGCISQEEIDNINKGIISQHTHSGGSVKNKKMYLKYAILFQLRCLFKNDKAYNFFSSLLPYMPFKFVLIRLIMFLNALKNNDIRSLMALKYVWANKQVP